MCTALRVLPAVCQECDQPEGPVVSGLLARVDGSPGAAERAGVLVGCRLIALGGGAVTTSQSVQAAIQVRSPGTPNQHLRLPRPSDLGLERAPSPVGGSLYTTHNSDPHSHSWTVCVGWCSAALSRRGLEETNEPLTHSNTLGETEPGKAQHLLPPAGGRGARRSRGRTRAEVPAAAGLDSTADREQRGRALPGDHGQHATS